MEINRRGEESNENELESSTLAYCSDYCVVSHPSDPVRALNPMVTDLLGLHLSHKGVGKPHAAEKAFTFEWELSVQLTRRSKQIQEKDELAIKKLTGGDGQ